MNDIGLYNDGDQEWVGVYSTDDLANGEYTIEMLAGKTYASKVVESIDDGVVCGSSSTKKLVLELPADYKREISIPNLKVSFQIESLNDTCHSYPQVEDVVYQLKN